MPTSTTYQKPPHLSNKIQTVHWIRAQQLSKAAHNICIQLEFRASFFPVVQLMLLHTTNSKCQTPASKWIPYPL